MTNDRRTAEAAAILLAARANGQRPSDFPESCRPATRQEAYAIQAMIAPSLGPIGGWKVGSPSPDAEPMCSALPSSGILRSPAIVPGPFRYRGVETEIDFCIGRPLPPRSEPYTRREILAAIESCHAAIEIVECRFAEMDGATHLSALADLQNHHALILGAANAAWREIAFDRLTVRVTVDGARIAEGTGSNPAGDPIALLVWLANHGSLWAGGLKAGDIVTTGSWIGKIPVPPEATIVSSFEGFPPVEARLGDTDLTAQ
jgi:2-keto-4-pentenoate hydratase